MRCRVGPPTAPRGKGIKAHRPTIDPGPGLSNGLETRSVGPASLSAGRCYGEKGRLMPRPPHSNVKLGIWVLTPREDWRGPQPWAFTPPSNATTKAIACAVRWTRTDEFVRLLCTYSAYWKRWAWASLESGEGLGATDGRLCNGRCVGRAVFEGERQHRPSQSGWSVARVGATRPQLCRTGALQKHTLGPHVQLYSHARTVLVS